jgi:hypothetical protein
MAKQIADFRPTDSPVRGRGVAVFLGPGPARAPQAGQAARGTRTPIELVFDELDELLPSLPMELPARSRGG